MTPTTDSRPWTPPTTPWFGIGDNPPDRWRRALEDATIMLNMMPDLEIRSALKQAASGQGIDYGSDMGRFVSWAEQELGLDC